MNVKNFNNLNEFNNYLAKASTNLEKKFNSVSLEEIVQTIHLNAIDFFNGKSYPIDETLRFIKNVSHLKTLDKNSNENKHSSLLNKVVQIAAKGFSFLDAQECIQKIESLKQTDQKLFYQTLANWISDKKIPIKELNLGEEELLKCAPWLTYLDFTDGTDLTHFTFSEEFIGNILSKTKKLSHLIIANSEITGKCLGELKNTESLKKISINQCSHFNEKLPEDLSNLQDLTITHCATFNQELPNTLLNLENLFFNECQAFNQKLPECLSKLKNLTIFFCGSFNQNLPSNLLNLEELLFSFCGKFNGKLPSELPKLTHLEIDNCQEFNQSIPKSANLKILKLDNCGFNQKLPEGLSNLETLKILHCKNFEGALPKKLLKLEKLLIKNCGNFNQALPKEMPNLSELEIICEKFNNGNNPIPNLLKLQYLILNCPVLNQAFPNELPELFVLEVTHPNQLPKSLPKLKTFTLLKGDGFNDNLPDTPELSALTISHCSAFNKSLSTNLKKLNLLSISECNSYDQNFPDLPKLSWLKINACPAFNRVLPNTLNRLQVFELNNVPAFKPFEHPLQTSLLLSKFNPFLLKEAWQKLSPEEKEQQRKKLLSEQNAVKHLRDFISLVHIMEVPDDLFLSKYPELQIPFALISIENLIITGNDEEIEKKFTALKHKDNFLEYLAESIQSYPILTSYLVRKQKDAIVAALDKKKISINELSRENQLALLPLLTPQKIQNIITETPDQEKKQWLAALLQFEQFSGNTDAILKEFQEKNLSDPASYDELLTITQDLLKEIPFKTLAAFAEEDENSETILGYKFAMDDVHLSVVVPFLTLKKLIEYLKKQDIAAHKEVLNLATEKQKSAYLKEALTFFSTLQQWKLTKKSLDEQILLFNQNPTKEKHESLETSFVKISHSLKMQLKRFTLLLKALDQILSKHSPSQGFLHDAVKFLVLNAKRAEKIQREVEKMQTQIIKLSEKIESAKDQIPERFIDPLTNLVMSDPWTDENGNTLDKVTWRDCKGVNPYTRKPLNLTPNLTLKGEIEDFFKEHP